MSYKNQKPNRPCYGCKWNDQDYYCVWNLCNGKKKGMCDSGDRYEKIDTRTMRKIINDEIKKREKK